MNLIVEMNTPRTKLHLKPASPPADVLSYAVAACDFGRVLVARSASGVCAILLGDEAEELTADLANRFPQSTLVASEDAVKDDVAKVLQYIEKPSGGLHLKLDLRGTPFQRRVWEKLKTIPVGRTVSYRELASWLSPLASSRAVGNACAANPIALAIPCHRVVRGTGTLAGYRWGIERKRALIQKEAKA
ncbi:methylated-DNA--[protein]-cysteine S-methyltransferase [Rhizobium sp. BK176]|uniref:methylated-DNA--[protein]-cysteine S-methyltransferase n=1 Tax=Rhizobium sp. BK176 TaxID=2587071 RepID=UPI002166F5C0|nr:methylated-DNA--[protein]-cysteine S-methyltransferase [Rhizobium sp. BK176]MCS4091945.1 methylated-DNA-[protein]-cysteine S-methyltransferase/AraC family transcriptional regulator of adaptative response/methylated-DNA-[protein]-cysteine methyltransferase [Rhizobium sp. BK176]